MDQRVHDLASAQLTNQGDAAFAQTYSQFHFNAGFGVFYNAPRFYAGLSVPQLWSNTFRGTANGFIPPAWHLYGSTGGYIYVNDIYTFNPHLQIKGTINAPFQADLVLRNSLFNRFSIVVGYRTENSLIFGADVLFAGKCRVGYSFNHDIGRLATAKGASHELYVGVGLPYHNSREEFSQRHYIGRNGKFKRDFRKGYKQRRWYK